MRQYCSVCQYPLATCVCSAVRPVESPVSISIVQHPNEVKHAKNTARLVALCIEKTHLVVSDNAEHMASLRRRCRKQKTALLYPSMQSRSWENNKDASETLSHLIFLDGSWRQAYAIWQQHAWLQSLPGYHFSSAPPSSYAIRHTQDPAHLSTLEAVAYTLSSGFETDVQVLEQLQQSMQSHWQGPAAHRR